MTYRLSARLFVCVKLAQERAILNCMMFADYNEAFRERDGESTVSYTAVRLKPGFLDVSSAEIAMSILIALFQRI